MKIRNRQNKHASLVGAGLLLSALAVVAWDGPTDPSTWTLLTNELEVVRGQLVGRMVEAASAGVDTNRAAVSLTTIQQFQTWARYDRENPDKIDVALGNAWWSDNIVPDDYPLSLPFEEVQDCIDLGKAMIGQLQDQVDGKYLLQPSPDLKAWAAVTQGVDAWQLDGQPFFPSGFTWMPNEPEYLEAYWRIGGLWCPLSQLQSDGTVHWNVNNAPGWGNIARLNDQHLKKQAPNVFTFGWVLAGWMKTAHPDIEEGRRNFPRWDIDHPMIRTWVQQYVSELYPEACAASGTHMARIHNLANEPHFAMREGGWAVEYGVSEHTKDKYQAWLEDKYTTVGNLNTAHGASYADFAAARNAFPFYTTNSNPAKWGMPLSLRGGPLWYDVCRFNMDRVNEWFTFLADVIRTNDPGGWGCSIKLTGWSLTEPYRDGGLDLERLARLQGVLGSDLNNASWRGRDVRNNHAPWKNHYAMNWIEQAMCLDFYRSISPGKPFYDSEWHALDNDHKNLDLSPEYVRAAMWLAMTHGCGILDTWVWGRESSGQFDTVNSEFVTEVLTQPRVLDTYGRTMRELNAHAASVLSVVPQNRQFFIYYTEDSAIQDGDYMSDLIAVYESLKLLNLPVGFTTPTQIVNLTTNHTVIVPRTPFIAEASLAPLQAFPGPVVLVDPANCFTKTEHGAARGDHGITPHGTVALDEACFMVGDLEALLGPLAVPPPVQVHIRDVLGQPARGVFAMQSQAASGGAVTLCLLNASKYLRAVDLPLPPGFTAWRDLVTGNLTWSNRTMAPLDLLLVRSDHGTPPSAPPVDPTSSGGRIRFVAPEGYANGSLDLHPDWSARNMTVDISGSGTVAVPGFDNAIRVAGGVVSNGTTYTVSMDFALTEESMAPVAEGVQGKPLINAGFYTTATASAPGNRLNVMVKRDWRNEGFDYNLTLHTDWGSWNSHPPHTEGWLTSDRLDAGYFGIARDCLRSNSELMRLTLELTAGATTNDWRLRTSLYNLECGTPSVPVMRFTTSGISFNATGLVYGGFGGGQSDGNARVSNRFVDSFLFHNGTLTPWELFTLDYELSGVKTDDRDGDRLQDWGEYVFGGNPTNALDVGVQPWFDASTGSYRYALIGDDTVVAHVLSTTNLSPPTGWVTNFTRSVLARDGVMSNYVFGAGTPDEQRFFKLLLE